MERKHAWAWLLLGAISAGFGRGFQAIPVVAWLEPLFLLQFLYHASFQEASWRAKLGILLAAIASKAAGLAFALAGALNDPSFTVLGVTVVAIAATLGSTALVLIPYMGDSLYRSRFPSAQAASVCVFPTLLTALWIVYSRVSPFGTMGHPAYSQFDWKALVLTASFWGMSGITFLMSWASSLLHQLLICRNPKTLSLISPPLPNRAPSLHTPLLSRRYSVAEASSPTFLPPSLAWHVRVFGTIFFLALLYGGAQNAVFSGRFYQRSIQETYHETFGASCILESEAQGESLERLWTETEGRIAAGDDVVLWSETAASLQGDAEETALIARAGALAHEGAKSRGPNEPGPYIGLSYYKVLEGGEPTGSLHVKRSAKIRRRGSRAGRTHIRNVQREGSGVRDVVQEGSLSGHATVDLVTGAHGKDRESVTRGASGTSVWGTVSEFVNNGLELLSGSDSDELAAVNSFVLVGPSGNPILKYNKTHPVPIVEDEVVPGERGLAVAETGLGTMSVAVCFDFRFPELLRQSGQKRVALMLQPAWTWGPVGFLEVYVGAFRAVENGFHLFRCSSNGYTAAVSPLYDVELMRETLSSGTINARLPRLQHVPTFYASYGFALEYACVVVGVLFYLLAVLPSRTVAFVSRHWPAPVRRFFFGTEQDLDSFGHSRGYLDGASAYTSLH